MGCRSGHHSLLKNIVRGKNRGRDGLIRSPRLRTPPQERRIDNYKGSIRLREHSWSYYGFMIDIGYCAWIRLDGRIWISCTNVANDTNSHHK